MTFIPLTSKRTPTNDALSSCQPLRVPPLSLANDYIHERNGKYMKYDNLINEIKTKIESLVERRRADIKNVETAILTAKEGISKASQDMDNATFESNAKAYKKAKEEKEDYSVSLEMYERRLEQIRGSELIAENDSVAVDESIVKAQDDIKKDATEKIGAIIRELILVYSEYRSDINALDSVRHEWRERVWKKQKQIGRNMYEIDMPKNYDDGGLSLYLNDVTKRDFVVNYFGIDITADDRSELIKALTK